MFLVPGRINCKRQQQSREKCHEINNPELVSCLPLPQIASGSNYVAASQTICLSPSTCGTRTWFHATRYALTSCWFRFILPIPFVHLENSQIFKADDKGLNRDTKIESLQCKLPSRHNRIYADGSLMTRVCLNFASLFVFNSFCRETTQVVFVD